MVLLWLPVSARPQHGDHCDQGVRVPRPRHHRLPRPGAGLVGAPTRASQPRQHGAGLRLLRHGPH